MSDVAVPAIVRQELKEKEGLIRRLANKVSLHADTAEAITLQFASALETTFGAVCAAAVDAQFGTSTPSGIPEYTIGPVPVVALGGVVMKGIALALHAANAGQSDAADHLGNVADGVLSGAGALTTMRLLLEMKAAAGQAPAAPAASTASPPAPPPAA